MARPTDYTPEIGATICERLASGETLNQILKTEGMPDRVTVWRWQQANETFRNLYAQSRIEQAHFWADDIVDISDDGTRDYKESGDKGPVVDMDHISRSRLRVDTRKFLMSKIVPKIYGDRIAQEITGADGGPIKTESRTDEEAARFAEMLAKAKQRQE